MMVNKAAFKITMLAVVIVRESVTGAAGREAKRLLVLLQTEGRR